MNSALTLLWDIARTLLVVGVIIFVHELGHFLAAKKVGIKVERFSIGFGPRLLGFKRGDTDYCISWFPVFGGYVKMAGENPADDSNEDEEGQFSSAPVSHRAAVALAGPGMNMIFAVFAFTLAYMVGLPPDPGTTIGYVEPDSPASKAGIISGDKFLSIDGYKVKVWDDIRESVSIKPEKEIQISLLRNGNEMNLQATPERMEGLVFSIDLELQDELDDKTIPENLKKGFEGSSIPLSPDAAVLVEEAGSEWTITDKDSNYLVRKEENRLDVYRETELVFSIDLGFQEALNNSAISESLKQRFADRRNALSPEAMVMVDEQDRYWTITDADKIYTISNEEDRLDIYREVDIGKIGVSPVIKPIVGEVEQGSAAAEAGFRPDDIIEAINNVEVGHIVEFANELAELQSSSVKEAVLRVRRDEGTVEAITLELGEDGIPVSLEGLTWLSTGKAVKLGPITALRKAIPETVRMGGKIFQVLKRMIIREVPAKYIAGPIGIVQITMAVVKTGLAGIFRFAGFLSVNLGIVNLLPLFITDGALLVFLVVEKLRSRPLEQKRQLIIQQVGIGFLIFLFLLLTYNDVFRWIRGPF